MLRPKKYILASILIITITFVMSVYFYIMIENLTIYKQQNLMRKRFNSASTKTILFWNPFFGHKTLYFDPEILQSCPGHKNCVATYDRHIIKEENFDAILFHGIDGLDSDDLPKKRSIKQRYVFVSMESPVNEAAFTFFPENYFNLTMTYDLNSDVPYPYFNIIEKKSGIAVAPSLTIKWNTSYEDADEKNNDIVKLVKGKTNMAAWFRSHCKTSSGREYYVHNLEQHMNVDKFGNCKLNDKFCSHSQNCFVEIVEPYYFFYLSFENSFCQDYVTEKFTNALQHYVIPVVYGGADYRRFAPPHSYINALDFESPKALAEYLLKLSKNHTEYLNYFRWKKNYVVGPNQNTLCDLCQMLHENNGTKIYKNISNWYNSIIQCPLQKTLDDQTESFGPLYVTKDTLQLP